MNTNNHECLGSALLFTKRAGISKLEFNSGYVDSKSGSYK
jgi:hypothetical protein